MLYAVCTRLRDVELVPYVRIMGHVLACGMLRWCRIRIVRYVLACEMLACLSIQWSIILTLHPG